MKTTKNKLSLKLLALIILLVIFLNLNYFLYLSQNKKSSWEKTKVIDKLPKSSLDSLGLKIIGIFFLISLIGGIILEIRFFSHLLKNKNLGFPPFIYSTLTVRNALEGLILIIFFLSIFRFIGNFLLKEIIIKQPNFLNLLLNAFFQIFSILTILTFFDKKELGIKIEETRRLLIFLLSGIKTYIGILPLLVLSGFISTLILKILNLKPQPMPIVIFFLKEKNILNLSLLALEAIFIAPLLEELIFRGVIFRLLRKRYPFLFSSLIAGVAFSFLHYNSFSFLPILILAVALAYIYERQKNILAPIFLHSLHNFLTLLILFSVRGG